MLTNPINNKKIGLHGIWWGLVFSFLLTGCSENKKEARPVIIQWQGNRAESIVIPRELLAGIPGDSIEQLLHIQLANTRINPSPILGEYFITDDAVTFRPLIALTHGLKYEVRMRSRLLSEIVIPLQDSLDAPEVVSIYPTSDTVPLNLLKIYIAFSKPMQEGQSLNNITVIKNRRDTIPSVFLDLQPELWNQERTLLTLWLDPGRIKRDLQPNIKMGSPLQKENSYQILITNGWQDTRAVSLGHTYKKEFFVGLRDSLSPDTERWTIHTPKAGSREPLKIDLREPLDYVLLKNAVRMVDNRNNVVNGSIETEAEETILNFIPSGEWSPGDYTVEIESRLEDLAGNNLGRLFDKDLTRKSKATSKDVYKRSFHIQ